MMDGILHVLAYSVLDDSVFGQPTNSEDGCVGEELTEHHEYLA
jgi:hypothetical protein